jgi:hypothetical protein
VSATTPRDFHGIKTKETYLKLSCAVGVEGLLVDVGGESEGIEESGWGNNTELVFVSHLDGRRASSTLGWCEGSGRAEEGGEDGELHGDGCACKLNEGKIVCRITELS